MNIYKFNAPAGIIFDSPDIQQNDQTWLGSFVMNPGNNFTHWAYFSLGSFQSVSSGNYADTFEFNLYKGTYNGIHELMDTQSLTVMYHRANTVILSLVDTGAPFDANDVGQNINFGTLESGERQSFDIMVKASDGYTLSMSAQNNGNLVHQTGPSKIALTAIVDGSPVSLSSSSTSPVIVANNAATTPIGGERIPCEFQVGDVSTALGGSYSEAITITATAY
jgi:hypothetical protein